jgi:hypothetical protein
MTTTTTMNKRRPTRAFLAAIAAGLGILALGGGVAFATIPGAGGVIRACYAKLNGVVRVIDSGASCRMTENPLSWNQVGQQGLQGPAGPQGAKGDQGAQGAQGLKGDQGAQGAPGQQGPNGDAGPTGAAGAQGPQGPQGEQGPQGPQGPSGGFSGYEVRTFDFNVPNLGWGEGTALCSDGKHPIGGGYFSDSENLRILHDYPNNARTGWYILAHNDDLFSTWQVEAYAICANVSY